ncbi:DNA gyrase subunit A, partial [archaeon]
RDHDSLLCISDRWVAYSLGAYQVPLGSRYAKGTPLPSVLPMDADEHLTSLLPVADFGDDQHESSLLLLTRCGLIKRTPLQAFESISARGLRVMTLNPSDALLWVRRVKATDDIFVATR